MNHDIYKRIEELSTQTDLITFNIPYEDASFLDRVISMYGEPTELTDQVVYIKICGTEIKKMLTKGCPRCKEGKIKPFAYGIEMWKNEDLVMPPGAYDIFGVIPNFGCTICGYVFRIDLWY